jgi:hypothetical protein
MLALRGSALGLALLSPLVTTMPGCEGEGSDPGAPIASEDEDMDMMEEADVCIEWCDPVEQDCPPGESCLPDQPGFSCRGLPSAAEGERRGLYDACEAGSQTCNAGLVCLQAAAPGCTGGTGCCVAYCDTNRPECSDGTACYPIFEAAAMCYPDVGVCVLF